MNSFLQNELSTIVTDGAFGKNVNLDSFEQTTNTVRLDQFMSTVVFGTIKTSDQSAYHVVIKLKLRDEKEREDNKIDIQFHNEKTMYEKIIPFLLSKYGTTARDVCNVPTLPHFYYGRNKCGEFAETDLIILENANLLGYRLCEERLFLDYDHLISALQALAKFHALSYTAKHRDPAGFREIVADILDMQFRPDASWLFQGVSLWKFVKRGVDRLLERDGDAYLNHEHLRRLVQLFGDVENSKRRALRPREPLSVVCHGDFNRNNVMFRYDGAGGCPVDALPYDFGGIRYGSPALDLSYFLYANTTQTMRRSRWDDLLDAYCSTLAAAVPPGTRVPDRTELDSEMAASALFGLAYASFLLPFHSSYGKYEGVTLADGFAHFGGVAETELVADMVQHFVDMAYTNV